MTPDVSFRRLLAASALVFVLLLAFLAGRVRAGADPAQATAAPAAISTPATGPGFGGSSLPDDNPPATQAS
jgi:hypothetical protein